MYAKIFASLWQGSMVGKPDAQLVFVYMLANCQRDGSIDCTPEVIGALTGIGNERVLEAIRYLESPDVRSRTPDEEGRRIVLLDDHRDWGWRIVNYERYRSTVNEDERRAKARERMRSVRKNERVLRTVRETFAEMRTVRNCSQPFAQAEAEVEEKAEPKGGFPSASLQENAASRAVECEADSAGADTAGETACSDAGTRAGSKEAPVGPVAIGSLVRGIAARLEIPDRATRTAAARPATNGCEDASAPKSDTKRDPERNTEAAEYVSPVYEIAKPHGGAAVSETLSLCGRLHNCGIRHTGVLKGIARHWLDNRGRIRNRWAYYSPGSDGFETLRQIISAESAVEEHRIAEAATREWLESVRAP